MSFSLSHSLFLSFLTQSCSLPLSLLFISQSSSLSLSLPLSSLTWSSVFCFVSSLFLSLSLSLSFSLSQSLLLFLSPLSSCLLVFLCLLSFFLSFSIPLFHSLTLPALTWSSGLPLSPLFNEPATTSTDLMALRPQS